MSRSLSHNYSGKYHGKVYSDYDDLLLFRELGLEPDQVGKAVVAVGQNRLLLGHMAIQPLQQMGRVFETAVPKGIRFHILKIHQALLYIILRLPKLMGQPPITCG